MIFRLSIAPQVEEEHSQIARPARSLFVRRESREDFLEESEDEFTAT